MGQIDKRGEERTRALVRARLRGSGLERDACILDLSSQGLLLTAAMPPKFAHSVTIVANGYTIKGQVCWVDERKFGITLDAPIVVDDVVEARILAPKRRTASPGLPEHFGARPVSASASLTLGDYFQLKWLRYALIVIAGIAGTIYLKRTVDAATAGLAEQVAAAKAVSQAES